ncbi:hypothetical protein SCFA_1030001 [anaerobic digester metagenome]|uniref:Uncharacterized protein n=1 Tax=anaerobic digester metagenome TaxID=1263854 RepID=A0A485LTZ3_9ZZZZ
MTRRTSLIPSQTSLVLCSRAGVSFELKDLICVEEIAQEWAAAENLVKSPCARYRQDGWMQEPFHPRAGTETVRPRETYRVRG